jgi:hypothetical protein
VEKKVQVLEANPVKAAVELDSDSETTSDEDAAARSYSAEIGSLTAQELTIVCHLLVVFSFCFSGICMNLVLIE